MVFTFFTPLVERLFAETKSLSLFQQQIRLDSCKSCVPTHSSLKDTVVDVVSATLRAGEGEPLTVFVALLVGQLDRSSQHAISLFLLLVLLLSPELTRVQTWHGEKDNSSLHHRLFYPVTFHLFAFCRTTVLIQMGQKKKKIHPHHLIL